MPEPRINEAIASELEEIVNYGDKWSSVEGVLDHLNDVVKIIRGAGGSLWMTDNYVHEKRGNPLKEVPDVTLIEAARVAWEAVKDKPERKQWFTHLGMDTALRKVLADSSWLSHIEGRQWNPHLRRLVDMGVLERVELVGSRGGPGGVAYKLREQYRRKAA